METREARCYWAGQLIEKYSLSSAGDEENLLVVLKDRLSKGMMTFSQVGVTFVLEELCVDIMECGKIAAMHNLKK